MRAAAEQYVRKVSGSTKPSKANAATFERAIAEVAASTERLLDSLVTAAPPRDREVEAARARARAETLRPGSGLEDTAALNTGRHLPIHG